MKNLDLRQFNSFNPSYDDYGDPVDYALTEAVKATIERLNGCTGIDAIVNLATDPAPFYERVKYRIIGSRYDPDLGSVHTLKNDATGELLRDVPLDNVDCVSDNPRHVIDLLIRELENAGVFCPLRHSDNW